MSSSIFQIQDGLSQRDREFPELAKCPISTNSAFEESILETMKKYAQENGYPHFFDNVDLPQVISMMNGQADGKTDPTVTLYAICAKLMGRVQNKFNDFPDKRIDFYYRKVLKENNHEAEGDKAIVSFEVDNDDVSCILPQGTRFSAGENSKGESIEFESINDSSINDVKVAKIFTVSCASGKPISQQEIPVHSPKMVLGQELTPYPLFGLRRSSEARNGTIFSKVGICVSDRILYMPSGVRNVEMEFIFTQGSVHKTVIEKKIGNAKEFAAAFTNAFKLSFTTENGWFNIENYKVGCSNIYSECRENTIVLKFSLKDTDPAITNYDTKIHSGNYHTQNPVLRILINPRKSYALWFALIKLQLQNIRIATNVSKCRDISVSNEYGPASTLLPVQPFGAIPSVGSSFIIGSKEICGKKLNTLSVHGKWCGLPNCNDFSEWYSQYENAPHTSDFIVSLSGLYGGEWLPSKKNAIKCNLFSSYQNNLRERSSTNKGISPEFKISFDNIVCSRTNKSVPENENFMYSPTMKDGFFKIRLIAPSKAFMHQEITRAVCNSFLEQVFKKKNSVNIPNQPYTPSLEDLYIDYSAYTEVSTSSNEFGMTNGIFFLHPFGFSDKETFFIQNGALYLGLTFHGKPKKVNLYFMLNRDSSTRGIKNGVFQWSYLSSFGWRTLPNEKRLADSTANFTSSGIITIDLPNDMASENPLMPSGYYWIRINPCNDCWRECSRLLGIFPQSLEVKRVSGFEDGYLLEHCKPYTIKELTTSISGLSNVYQLEESFGGKARESDFKMRARIAESLYHKNHATCTEDYERMILEHFPEIHKVKCFPHTRIDETNGQFDCLCPRTLLVVPVSTLYKDGSFQLDPCLNGSVLQEIRKFLQDRITGIAKVQVINPFFDKIQVRCNVRFKTNKNEGKNLLDLNEKINRYLSPWYPQESGITKHFGWTINKTALKTYIESIDYVEHVSDDLTIMKIAPTNEQKFLVNLSQKTNNEFLHGSYPWSIPVPMRKHFINDIEPCKKSRNVYVNNGYGGLIIGQTFIIRK